MARRYLLTVPTLLAAALVSLCALAAEPPQPRPPAILCIDDDGNCPTTPVQPGRGIKWHPGHYLLTYIKSPQSDLEDLRNETTVLGAQVRYLWADLEPRKGVYDFSLIESDLRLLQSMPVPKRLVAQILDIRFDTNNPHGIVPNYLMEDAEYNGGIVRTTNGYSARLWEKQTMDRLIALYQELGKRFDKEPYFEAIATRETAPSFGGVGPPPGYKQSDMAAQLKRLISSARAAWPNTNVFVYTNYLVGELEGVVKHAHDNMAGAGGPDVTPRHPSAGARIILGIDGNVEYRGKMPIAFAVQSPELCGKEGCNLPEDIYNFAVDTLGTNYLFWLRFGNKKDTATAKYSWQNGMLPVIRSKGGRINRACPLSFKNGCKTD